MKKTISKVSKNKIKIVGHNVSFDIEFLKMFFKQTGCPGTWERYFDFQIIDTSVISKFLIECNKLPNTLKSLELLSEHFNLKFDGEKKFHSALFDAEITCKIYFELLSLIKD